MFGSKTLYSTLTNFLYTTQEKKEEKKGNTYLSQYNTKSVKLLGYQSLQLGSIRECKLVSPASVQMKVIKGSLERQQQDNKRE